MQITYSRIMDYLATKRWAYILLGSIIILIGSICILVSLYESIVEIVQKILLAVGASIIAGGVVFFVDIIRQMANDNIFKKIDTIIIKAGVTEIYNKRDIDKYDSLMDNLSANLDITGYSLNAFFDSFNLLVLDKCRDNGNIKIRILVVNPESEFSRHRAEEEGNEPGYHKGRVDRLIETFREVNNIEIRLIDTPLSTMIFRIDETMFVGPHLYKKQSKQTLTYELRNDGWLFKKYQSEFDEMWGDSIEI